MIRIFTTYLLVFLTVVTASAVQTRFTMDAPSAVEVGQQFRLSFTLNERGNNLKLPPGIENNFDILMGPRTSQSFSSSTINGKTTQETTYGFTYIIRAKQDGTFELRSASIEVGGKIFESNSVKIQVVKAQSKPVQPQAGAGGSGGNSGADQQRFGVLAGNRLLYPVAVGVLGVVVQLGHLQGALAGAVVDGAHSPTLPAAIAVIAGVLGDIAVAVIHRQGIASADGLTI